MKNVFALLFLITLFVSCNNDDENNSENVSATFNFSHHWDGIEVNQTLFNNIQFNNANGESMSIEKLRYLISNIKFHKPGGEIIDVEGYVLVDVNNSTGLSYTSNTEIPEGEYTNVTFTFGFNNDDNYSQTYTDLNSASWNVPTMLGGGYHFMQLEGKFIDNTATETGYAFHAIRAVDNSDPANQIFQDTFIDVSLGAVTVSNDVTFNVAMNIAEWFENPNTWDLNNLNNMLMSNFDAQVMIFQNGQNVFTLNDIVQ